MAQEKAIFCPRFLFPNVAVRLFTAFYPEESIFPQTGFGWGILYKKLCRKIRLSIKNCYTKEPKSA